MGDLYLGIAVITFTSLVAYCSMLLLASGLNSRGLNGLAFSVVILIVLYIVQVWDSPGLTKLLPFPNLIVLGNWLPVAASLLAAVVWCDCRYSITRRAISIGALSSVAGYSLLAPLLGSAPECRNLWDPPGICVQTAPSTCGAACAATLLRLHGIHATEAQMAELCLTRQGTTWKGLYRGLKLMTADTRWDVEVLECEARDLESIPGPKLICIGVADASGINAYYSQEFGLKPGTTHSVILLKKVGNGCVRIVDPTPNVGEEIWTREMLHTVWQRPAMRLVARPLAQLD